MRIAGYTYNADQYCVPCTYALITTVTFPDMTDEQIVEQLDILGTAMNIPVYNERMYDSSDWPKVVFADQIEEIEYCGRCSTVLV